MIPYWLLRLLPLFEYICPVCRKGVRQSAHKCPHCGERFPLAIRVPPSFLKDPKKLEEYVHKYIFPRVSAFERNYLTKYFTVLFSDGFESNDFTAWTGTSISGATIATDNSVAHHGRINAKCAGLQSAGEYAYVYKVLDDSYATLYLRYYVRFASLFNNALGALLGLFRNSTTGVAYIYVDPSTSKWGVYNAITATAYWEAGTSTISANTWYCLELRVTVSATVGILQLWVNGALKVDQSSLNTGADNLVRVDAGAYIPGAEAAERILFSDCVVVADCRIRCEKPLFHILRGRGGDKRLGTTYQQPYTRPPHY